MNLEHRDMDSLLDYDELGLSDVITFCLLCLHYASVSKL